MGALVKHWPRILVTLLPLVFALLHASRRGASGRAGAAGQHHLRLPLACDHARTLDERVVIVDIDEKSLAKVGRWPWGRNKLAELTNELFDRQKIALLGFDVVFAEA
jgi:adenylate cyclase